MQCVLVKRLHAHRTLRRRTAALSATAGGCRSAALGLQCCSDRAHSLAGRVMERIGMKKMLLVLYAVWFTIGLVTVSAPGL